MRSRILTNLLLLAVVIILGYIICSSDSEQGTVLSEMDRNSIESIEIQHRDRYVVLKKRDDGWHMTRPINIAANDFRINSVLNLINSESVARYAVSDIDLNRFKLDKPRTTIRFSDGVEELRFDFGNTNPINRLRYLRAGDYVHLIDDHLYPLVSSQMGTLISHALLPADSDIIDLRIPGYRFSRTGVDWTLNPELSAFSSDDITNFITNWEQARAFGVHDLTERQRLGEIELTYRIDGITQSASLLITDTDPWLIIARPELGIEYHFDIANYDTLLNPAAEADRAILDAEEAIVNQR